MRKTKVLALALMFGVAASMTSFAGEWKQDANGWKYQNDDGSFKTGWFFNMPDQSWYCFDENGIMKTNAWVESDGKSYYVGEDGRMLTNSITPDGTYVDKNGLARDINTKGYDNVVDTSITVKQNDAEVAIPCKIYYDNNRKGTYTKVRYDSAGIKVFDDEVPRLVVTHTVLSTGGYSGTYMRVDMYVNGEKQASLGENNSIDIRFDKDYTVVDFPYEILNDGDTVELYITL